MVRLCWQRRRSTAPIISSLKARLQRRGAGVSAAPRDSETNPWSSMVCFLKRRSAMLRFLLGPFVALLPKRWRCSLALLPSADWRVPSILSGLAEFLVAVAAMLYWYSYSVTTWVSRGLDLALAGKAGPGVNEQEIGFMAILADCLLRRRGQRPARGRGLCGKRSWNSSSVCAGSDLSENHRAARPERRRTGRLHGRKFVFVCRSDPRKTSRFTNRRHSR